MNTILNLLLHLVFNILWFIAIPLTFILAFVLIYMGTVYFAFVIFSLIRNNRLAQSSSYRDIVCTILILAISTPLGLLIGYAGYIYLLEPCFPFIDYVITSGK